MLKRSLIFIGFTLLASAALSAQSRSRLIIDSGHNEGIESMVHHDKSRTLLTADANGLVKVWSMATDKLLYQINTGFQGNITLKPHPSKKQFAILVSRPGFTRIAVWDWEKNSELFGKELADKPIQFEYSGKGRYLFMTRISTPSLLLLDSQSGREFSYLKRLYDLFSFGYIGSSETRIMTYSNSGALKYWDIRTSTLQNETATQANLSQITVLQTEGKRYFLARRGSTLFLIDRLSGSIRDRLSNEDMIDFSVDPAKGVVSVTERSRTTGKWRIRSVQTTGGRFSPLGLDDLLNGSPSLLNDEAAPRDNTGFFSLNGSLTGSEIVGNRILLSDDKGSLWEIDPLNLTPSPYKRNLLADIRDLQFIGDTLYILSDKDLAEVTSRNFAKRRNASLNGFSDIAIGWQDSPLPGETEMEPADQGNVIIWTKDNVKKGYVLYSPQEERVLNSNYNFDSSLNQVHVRNNQVLVLENSGEASLNNIHTGFRDFQFSSLGTVSLNFLNDTTLLGGKSLMKSGRNPMFTVQTETGEIIPLQDDRFLVYDILSPAEGNRAFTIGLAQKNGGVETIIRSHNRETPGSGSKVYSRPGEWINATFTVDAASYTPTLYGTVTGKDLVRIAGTRKTSWEYDNHIRKIFYHNALLYILNTNGSLTLFDPQKGKKLLDFYLMEDGKWIALPGEGPSQPYISSPETADLFNAYDFRTGRAVRKSYFLME